MSQYYADKETPQSAHMQNFRILHNILLWGLWTQVQRIVHQPHFAAAIKASAA